MRSSSGSTGRRAPAWRSRAARGTRHPPWWLWQVRAAHAAQRRSVPVVRTARGHAFRARRHQLAVRRSRLPTSSAICTRRKLRRQCSNGISALAGACCSKSPTCSARAPTNTSLTPSTRARASCSCRARGSHATRNSSGPTRYLGGGRRDLTFSYVWAKGTADLNNYDQFYGNFRNPIIRANENNLTPRRTCGIACWCAATSACPGNGTLRRARVRSGFPWSAVDEFQDFVGPSNRTGRLPTVGNLDFQLTRPLRFRKYRFKAGIEDLQRVWRVGRARRAESSVIPLLRAVLQSHRTLDRVFVCVDQVVEHDPPS